MQKITPQEARKRSVPDANNGPGAKPGDSTKPLLRKKAARSSDKAVVWVKKDSTISRRVIETGLNDNANVQVLSGLNEGDVVVSGIIQAGDEKNGSTATRSPFMPPRRGGGGGGGGGTWSSIVNPQPMMDSMRTEHQY